MTSITPPGSGHDAVRARALAGVRAQRELKPPKSFGGAIGSHDRVRWAKGGVKLVLRYYRGHRPTSQQVRDVARAVRLIPARDRQLLRREHTEINVFRRKSFKKMGHGYVMVGQAWLTQLGDGTRHGRAIRVAAGHSSRLQTTQHEIGHVVSWVRRGDASERAADRYANRY